LVKAANIDAAFTFNYFDDQKRNFKFMQADFQVLKQKFYAFSYWQAFLFINYIELGIFALKLQINQ